MDSYSNFKCNGSLVLVTDNFERTIEQVTEALFKSKSFKINFATKYLGPNWPEYTVYSEIYTCVEELHQPILNTNSVILFV